MMIRSTLSELVSYLPPQNRIKDDVARDTVQTKQTKTLQSHSQPAREEEDVLQMMV